MEHKYYYIYLITNTLNQRSYVGSRMYNRELKEYVNENKHKAYLGSSKHLNKDINEFGVWNFSKEIIGVYPFTTKEELLNTETKYVVLFNTMYPNGYNRVLPNNQMKIYHNESGELNSFYGKTHSEESKEKIRKTKKGLKGYPHTEEFKIKVAENNIKYKTGTTHSDETKKAISKKLKGRQLSEEHKKKLREMQTNVWLKRKNKLNNNEA